MKKTNQLDADFFTLIKNISNQVLLDELTSRVQKEIISLDNAMFVKLIKNSTLLKELESRIKEKIIRFNYDSSEIIDGLISWNATDEYRFEYRLIFEELEES